MTLALEGVARLLPSVLVAVSGVPNATSYALLYAAGSAFGALAGTPWLRRLDSATATGPVLDQELIEPEASAGGSLSTMATATVVLAGSTLLSQFVANVAPIVVNARLVGDTATAAAFTSAFILVRVPVFLFSPIQAMLLPTLTAAATTGHLSVYRRTLRIILIAIAAVGIPGAIASLLIGPWAVQFLFGAHVRLSGPVMGLLGVGTIGLMVAQVLQPALVALGRHRAVTMAWALGSVVLTGLLFLPGDPIRAAVIAQLVGSALVVAGMARSITGELGARAGHPAE
jgi:O-antigen/teichoic acid export membrane protein